MRVDQRVNTRDVEMLAGSQLQAESMPAARLARLAVLLAVERDALLDEIEGLRRDQPTRDRERLMRAVIRPMATSRGPALPGPPGLLGSGGDEAGGGADRRVCGATGERRGEMSEALTVKQAAGKLQVSIHTVYGLVADGQLAARRVGLKRGKIMIDAVDVEAYWAASKSVGGQPIKSSSRHLRPPSPSRRPS